MAFGVMTKQMIMAWENERVFEVLMANCVPKGKESDDAETRKQSVNSLICAVETVGIHNISNPTRLNILETFYKGFDDYAVDRRGDVGSWVRQ